LNYLYQNLY